MKMKEILLFILLILFAGFGFGQKKKLKFFITINDDDYLKQNIFFLIMFVIGPTDIEFLFLKLLI